MHYGLKQGLRFLAKEVEAKAYKKSCHIFKRDRIFSGDIYMFQYFR